MVAPNPRRAADPRPLDWAEWRCTPWLDGAEHRMLVESMALTGHKWDIQIGNVCTLAPFAITTSEAGCAELFRLAEGLAGELLEAEQRLGARPELWPALGLPRGVRRMLAGEQPWTPAAARVMRFDFHPTAEGWKVSEVNSDVPGGFNEASTWARRVGERMPNVALAGDPLARLAERLGRAAGELARVALVAAPGVPDDAQVVSGLAPALRKWGVASVRLDPERLCWDQGRAFCVLGGQRHYFGAIYRFFQGEWSRWVRSPEWSRVFRGGRTPVCNPPTAVLSESKRLPLLWEPLGLDMPLWRCLLPPTFGPWRALGSPGSRWVAKEAYANNGDHVVSGHWVSRRAWVGQLGWNLLRSGQTLVQERFETLALEGPVGPVHPCIGVYVIDGEACGIYGRVATGPLVDYAARDVAVLVRT